nr:putative reverse transcriptase domain, aspartic peptidase domain protein [Tanacetum cinerariifolium]
MDWLTEHHAMIDCHSYRVIFSDIHAPEYTYHGSLPGKPMQIISALQARTLLYHGCEGFLATIHDMTSEIPTIHDQPIISEFQDVFPDELPGIPPVREVEFNIELIPGAEPISKAPYRMAPVELKELKDHVAFLGHIVSAAGITMDPTKSCEELYFSNTSKMANVSKPISTPNEEFSDDTTPSVALKFLNEHKALELEIECLLRVVVSQDIMSVVQNNSADETSNLQS